MVHSVLAASSVGSLKRDPYRSPDTTSAKKQIGSIFSQILENEMDKLPNMPIECYTVTYGNDSRLHTFQYQTREYHY